MTPHIKKTDSQLLLSPKHNHQYLVKSGFSESPSLWWTLVWAPPIHIYGRLVFFFFFGGGFFFFQFACLLIEMIYRCRLAPLPSIHEICLLSILWGTSKLSTLIVESERTNLRASLSGRSFLRTKIPPSSSHFRSEDSLPGPDMVGNPKADNKKEQKEKVWISSRARDKRKALLGAFHGPLTCHIHFILEDLSSH